MVITNVLHVKQWPL